MRLLASYRDLLMPYGFEVLTAPDGQDAIPLVERNPDIQLVILDLAMPRMDGREWLRWFRSVRKELPVIVITAYKLDPDDAELKPAVVLEKPFHVAELLDLVGLFCGLSWPIPAQA
ncbi:MAG TPA: response regulator [Thermoanaerobaculia bacterium]|nr:response regulator [Thermoanaerobaculia bacterium]